MSDILGGLFGGNDATKGFDWLKNNPFMQQLLGGGQSALTGQQGTQNAWSSLLGLGGDSAASNAAFQKYLGSTGYQFQLGQGQNAISSNAGARGMLNSGSTAKALTSYGQGLGSQYFNNYLGQLSGLNNAQQGSVNAALGGAEAIGQAGTQGGTAQGQMNGAGMGGLLGFLGGFI